MMKVILPEAIIEGGSWMKKMRICFPEIDRQDIEEMLQGNDEELTVELDELIPSPNKVAEQHEDVNEPPIILISNQDLHKQQWTKSAVLQLNS
ncbi:hypothetical protein J6590_076398 [Homalodisca vitripennis]|nr:hypothetical protein J6590_076398 [Homalodisca vitripennis]